MLDLQPDLNFKSDSNLLQCAFLRLARKAVHSAQTYFSFSAHHREYSSPTRLVDGYMYIRMEVYWRVRSEKNHYASAVGCALYEKANRELSEHGEISLVPGPHSE